MHSETRTSTAMVLAVALTFIATNILTPTLVGVYVDSYGLSITLAGYSASIYMAGGGIGAGLVSLLVGRMSARVLLVCAACLLGIANLASIWAHGVTSILTVRFLAGIGEGAGLGLMAAAATQLRDPGRFYSVFTIALLVLSAGAQQLIPWLRGTFGGAMLFVPVGLFPVLLLPFLRLFPRLDAPRPRTPQARSVTTPSRVFAIGVVATLVIYTAYGAAFSFVERIGVSAGLSADAVARVIGWGYLVSALGALAAMATSNWRARGWRISLSLAIVIGSTFLCVMGTPVTYIAGVVLFFSAWYYFAPNLLNLMSLADPSGRLAAAVMGALEIGIAVGPFIAAPHVAGGQFGVVAFMGACGYAAGMLLLIPIVNQARLSGATYEVASGLS